jgi:hypothetical protein
MARARTTKKLAQRIDLNYFKRPTPFKRAKIWLSALVPVFAVGWIAWHGLARDSRVYSSGRMSGAHAVLEKQCAACHVQQAGTFSSKAADGACLACHDGPEHHAFKNLTPPDCAFCHSEHRGRTILSATSNENCAICHQRLQTSPGVHIYSFEDGHPQFAALRDGAKDPGTIRLNHAIHMQPIRQGPNGPIVQLECADCHRNYQGPWKYALSPNPVLASDQRHLDRPVDILPQRLPALSPYEPSNGRERMRPVEFVTACSECHLLTFDKRFEEGVPHDKPEVVHKFLVQKFQEYIAAHPGELHVTREPKRDLTGKPLPPEVRVVTPAQWVTERTADAEKLLWRKTCKQCHSYVAGSVTKRMASNSSGEPNVEAPLPEIAPARILDKWLPNAKFDHDAHRGFRCAGCHPKALASTESSDILVPGIDNCKTCHAPGVDHAESRCFGCHTYHDWSKRKEVRASFTLPELQTGR